MNRLKNAQYIALGATALSVTGIILSMSFSGILSDIGGVIALLGMVAGIASYVFGGLGKALSIAGKIAKWGWIVIPFPYDILTGICAFVAAIMALLFLPIIPVRMAYKERQRQMEIA